MPIGMQAPESKVEWKIGEPSEGIYRANLEKLPKELIKMLPDCEEQPVPTENDVKIQGLKNPICTIIIGFATDRVLEQILNGPKQTKYVVVIEPNLGRFHATLKRHYIGKYLDNPNIDWLLDVPIEEIQVHLYKMFCKFDAVSGPRAGLVQAPEIICDPFVYSEQGVDTVDNLKKITDAVIASSKQVFISMGCGNDSFNRWINGTRNFDNMFESYNAKNLTNKFKDVPAIVIGAGPSMDEFIEYAKKYDLENNALLIACDASLRRLLNEGIRPHLVTRCERKLTGIFDGVKKEDTKDMYYVYYPWCAPEFTDMFENSIMVFRDNGLCTWTEQDHLRCNGGVSSANAGLELAHDLGCKDIVLTGIDLCFLDGKSHTSGTMVEFDLEKSKPKWTQIENNQGDEVTTIPVWFRCLSEYQASIVKYQRLNKPKIINTSLKGVRINGTEVKPWSEVGDLFKTKHHVVKKISDNLIKPNKKTKDKFEKKRLETIKHLETFNQELQNVFNSIEECFQSNGMEEEKAINQMKCFTNPMEFTNTWEVYKKSLRDIYKPTCKVVDDFKQKWFLDEMISNLILDTVQLDVFKNENEVNSLRNLVDVEFIRLKRYIMKHQSLFRHFAYYTNRTLSLLKGEQIQIEGLENDNS